MFFEVNVVKKLSYVLTVTCQLRSPASLTLVILTVLQRSQFYVRDVQKRECLHPKSRE
jgi:hypothetical protein